MMSGTKRKSIFWVGSYGWLFQLILRFVVQPVRWNKTIPTSIQNKMAMIVEIMTGCFFFIEVQLPQLFLRLSSKQLLLVW